MLVHYRYIYFETAPTKRVLWPNSKALKPVWALDENVSIYISQLGGGLEEQH